MNKNGKALIITIVIGLACGVLLWYGMQWMLNYYLKPNIEKEIQTALKRNVTIEEMGYRLHLGIYMKNLAIFAKDNQTVDFIVNTAGLKFSPKELFLNKILKYSLSFKSNKISPEWIKVKGTYSLNSTRFDSLGSIILAGKPLIIKASSPYLKNFDNISFSIGAKEALLKGKVVLLNNSIKLDSTTFSTGSTELNVIGEIRDLKELPVLNATIQGPLELSDIKRLTLTPQQYRLADNLLGKINTKIALTCPLTNLKKVTGTIKLFSKQVTLKQLKLSSLAMQGNVSINGIKDIELKSQSYGGDITAFCDLTNQNNSWTYKTTTHITDLNIKALGADILRNSDNIAGTLNAQMSLSGDISKRESIAGEGWFLIIDGMLKEVSVLGEMADILNTPQLKKVRFEEAKATFKIAEEKVMTQDLQLNSPQMILFAKGSVDFDKRLDFLVTSQMAKEVFEGDVPQRLASLLILRAGAMIGDFIVSGTVDNPKLKIKPVPVEKAIGQVFQFLQDIQEATSSPESTPENGD